MGPPGLREILSFNEQGKLVERIESYRSDGREYFRLANRYDRLGIRTGTEVRKDGKVDSQISIKSNERGHPVEQVTVGPDGKKSTIKFSYKYDSNGRVVESVTTLSDPIVGSGGFIIGFGVPAGDYITVTTYDPSGRVVRTHSYLPGLSTPFGNSTVILDEKRRPIEVTSQDGESKPRITKNFFKYNARGDAIEFRNYESIVDSNVERVRDRFKVIDDKGTVQNGELTSDKPNMILWSVTVCDYEYDTFGNWTRKTCNWRTRDLKTFGPAGDPVTRTITYFE